MISGLWIIGYVPPYDYEPPSKPMSYEEAKFWVVVAVVAVIIYKAKKRRAEDPNRKPRDYWEKLNQKREAEAYRDSLRNPKGDR